QKNWKRAAECWFMLKSYEAAAKCFRKSRDTKSTALSMACHYENFNEWSKAAAAHRRAGKVINAQQCAARAYETAGQFVKAAVLWERLGQKDRALQLYKRGGDQEAVNRFIVERADIRQSQDETVSRLM